MRVNSKSPTPVFFSGQKRNAEYFELKHVWTTLKHCSVFVEINTSPLSHERPWLYLSILLLSAQWSVRSGSDVTNADVTKSWRHKGIATSDWLSTCGLQYKTDGSLILRGIYREPHVHGWRQGTSTVPIVSAHFHSLYRAAAAKYNAVAVLQCYLNNYRAS